MAVFSRLQRAWRRTRSIAATALFLVVVGAAILVGIGRLLVPYADRFIPELEARFSAALGTPVEIETAQGEWAGPGPALELEGVRIGPGGGQLRLERARLSYDPLAWLRPGVNPLRLEVIGAQLSVLRDAAGRWRLIGLGMRGDYSSDLDRVLGRAEIRLVEAVVRVSDESSGYARVLDVTEASLQRQGGSYAIEARLRPRGAEGAAARALLKVAADRRLQAVDGYLEAHNQFAGAWLGLLPAHIDGWRGRLDLEAWFDWRRSEPVDVLARFEAAQAGVLPVRGAHAPSVGGWAHWRHSDKRWRLDVNGLNFGAGSATTWLSAGSNRVGGWSLAAGPLPLGALDAWRGALLGEDVLGAWQLRGTAGELRLALDDEGRVRRASGLVRQLALMHESGSVCGPFELNLSIDDGSGRALLSAAQTECALPRLSAQAYPISALSIDAKLEQTPSAWRTRSAQAVWRTPEFTVGLEGGVDWVPGTEPLLDLRARIPRVAAAGSIDYLPERIIKPRTMEWLRRALRGGRFEDSQAVLSGRLSAWPFEQDGGRFEASTRMTELVLKYGRDWPVARSLEGELRFRTDSLSAAGGTARVAGVELREIEGRIPDLDAPRLDLQARIGREAGALLDWLPQLPLEGVEFLDKREWDLGGRAHIEASARLDLRDRTRLMTLDGAAVLDGVDAHAGVIDLRGINGRLRFDREGLRDSELLTTWSGNPAQLSWDRGETGDTLALRGRFPAADVLNVSLPAATDSSAWVSGSANWTLALEIGDGVNWLLLHSDLIGVESRLPAPLAKMAAVPRELHMAWPLDAAPVQEISVMFGERLAARMALAREQRLRGLSIALGADQTPVDPRGRFTISGEISRLEPLAWPAVLGAGAIGNDAAGVGTLRPEVSVRTDQLIVGNRFLGPTLITLLHDGGTEVLDLSGKNLAGRLRFSGGPDAMTVDANLQRLHWPAPAFEPVRSGSRPDLPKHWPAIHFICDDLRWHQANLGQVRVEAVPTAEGMEFDTLEARSPAMTLTGSGGWWQREGGMRSQLDLRLDADNLGNLLASFGYARLVEGGQTVLLLEASWPGTIGSFDLARIEGRLGLDVGAGKIPEVAPGAGRVLGLLSLQALPRRLLLDFGDVFGSGFEFDRAVGSIELHSGKAVTDGVRILAPAANLVIAGSTDLVEQTYDQTIYVRPGLGSALPILGALAGGPIGVGAGFALQGLLSPVLRGGAESIYKITGPWSDPEVRVVSEEPTVTREDPEPEE